MPNGPNRTSSPTTARAYANPRRAKSADGVQFDRYVSALEMPINRTFLRLTTRRQLQLSPLAGVKLNVDTHFLFPIPKLLNGTRSEKEAKITKVHSGSVGTPLQAACLRRWRGHFVHGFLHALLECRRWQSIFLSQASRPNN